MPEEVAAMSAALAFVVRVTRGQRPDQFMRALIGRKGQPRLPMPPGGPCECTSILRRRTLRIREPVLAQHLFRQLFVDVRGYQLAKCKCGRVILSLAAAGPALWKVVFLHKIPVSCGIGPVGRA